MTRQDAEDTIRLTVTVNAPKERAFYVFTDGLADWWPSEYTWSQNMVEAMTIEPRKGGRCTERGPHGFECDWGRVTVWNPPHQLAVFWQISPDRVPEPDPARSSDIEVRFITEGASQTRIEFEHRGFGRHGEGAAGYREAMGSEYGWPYILDRFVAAVG